MRCIFCLKEVNEPSIEHIIPKSIGCPDGLLLEKGEVCRTCNSFLGTNVDSVVKTYFEPILVFNNLRINNNQPKITGFRNLKVGVNGKKSTVYLNMSNNKTLLGDRIVPGYSNQKRCVDGQIDMKEIDNDKIKGTLKFSNKNLDIIKFKRGLYKIAYEIFMLKNLKYYSINVEKILKDKEIDNIRKFVRYGEGERKLLQIEDSNTKLETSLIHPNINKLNETDKVVIIRLIYFSFMMDFTSEHIYINNTIDKLVKDRPDVKYHIT